MNISELKCNDSRRCFAKRDPNSKTCSVLISDGGKYTQYEDGECPFCKAIREVTNGKVYAINRKYTYK